MLSSTIEGRLVRTARMALAATVLMATALHGASGQQAARLRLAVDAAPRVVQPQRSTSFLPLPVAADSGEHASPVVRGAQIGALVGVAAGLVYTLALNTKKSCTENNNVVCAQDQNDYRTFTYPLFGGVIGGVLGAVIASARQ